MLHWVQELAPHGVFTTDINLCVQSWNHWMVVHSGLTATDVIGRPLFELFPELVTRKLAEQFNRALEGQVSVLSSALHRYLLPFPPTVRDSGFTFMLQTARVGPLLSHRTVCGTITTIEDVTQREMHAQRTREYAAELETKVRERTARLDETVAQLESFSYTVAHDLRAPIRTFRGYAEILLEDYAGEFPDKARGYVERMKRAADGMDVLTRDLLQFSRISRQPITSEPIDVAHLVEEIVSHMRGLQAPGVLTIQRPLGRVIGNRTMVQQCLSNLLGNALKFISPGSEPRITIRTELRSPEEPAANSASPAPFISATTADAFVPAGEAEHGTQRLRIFVEDNGIGIPPEFQRKVFGIFERLQDSRRYEGTGIGLAIVARAVQRMQGSCGVESTPGVGSRFWIELPAASAHE